MGGSTLPVVILVAVGVLLLGLGGFLLYYTLKLQNQLLLPRTSNGDDVDDRPRGRKHRRSDDESDIKPHSKKKKRKGGSSPPSVQATTESLPSSESPKSRKKGTQAATRPSQHGEEAQPLLGAEAANASPEKSLPSKARGRSSSKTSENGVIGKPPRTNGRSARSGGAGSLATAETGQSTRSAKHRNSARGPQQNPEVNNTKRPTARQSAPAQAARGPEDAAWIPQSWSGSDGESSGTAFYQQRAARYRLQSTAAGNPQAAVSVKPHATAGTAPQTQPLRKHSYYSGRYDEAEQGIPVEEGSMAVLVVSTGDTDLSAPPRDGFLPRGHNGTRPVHLQVNSQEGQPQGQGESAATSKTTRSFASIHSSDFSSSDEEEEDEEEEVYNEPEQKPSRSRRDSGSKRSYHTGVSGRSYATIHSSDYSDSGEEEEEYADE